MRVVSVVSRLLHARPAAAALRTFATSSACCQTGADPKSPGLNHSGKLNLRGFEATASIPVSDVVASGKPRVSICRCWLSAKVCILLFRFRFDHSGSWATDLLISCHWCQSNLYIRFNIFSSVPLLRRLAHSSQQAHRRLDWPAPFDNRCSEEVLSVNS